MKLGGMLVLVVGICLLPTCSAEIGPNDLWQIKSPMDFTPGPEVSVDYWNIWATNSPMHFTPGVEIDEGVTLTPGIDEGISRTSGIDKGITLTPGIDKGITLTPGIDKGFTIDPEFAAESGV